MILYNNLFKKDYKFLILPSPFFTRYSIYVLSLPIVRPPLRSGTWVNCERDVWGFN